MATPYPARRRVAATVVVAAALLGLIALGLAVHPGLAVADPAPSTQPLVPLPPVGNPTPLLPVPTTPPPTNPPSTSPPPSTLPTPGTPGKPPDHTDPACKDTPLLPWCFEGIPPRDPNGPPSLIPGQLVPMPGDQFHFFSTGGVMPTLLGSGGADFSRFDIGYDAGQLWEVGKWDERFFGMLTRLGFSLHTWLVGVNTWLIGQAVDFNIAQFLLGPVTAMADTWKVLIVDKLGLAAFALIATAFVAGLLMLSGRLANGLAELATSLIAGAIFIMILANPAGTLLGDNGLLGNAKKFALQAAAITLSDKPEQTQAMEYQVAEPLIQGLGYALVVEPHMILDWGKSLDDPKHPLPNCLFAYKQILQQGGPFGNDDKPRVLMRNAGCGEQADFNAKATPERLVGVILVGFGSLVLIVLMALLSISLAMAQIVLAGAVVATPFACVSANLPRGGRNLLWWYCVTALSAALLVVFTLLGLAVYIRLIIGIFQSSNDSSLIMKFVVFDIVVFAGFVLHRKIKRGAGRIASNLIGKLARSTSRIGGAGGGGSLAPWAMAGAGLASGVALRSLMYEGRQEFRSITRPVRRGLRYGRRTGRRASRTGPGRFVLGQVRAGRQRMADARRAATRSAAGAGRAVLSRGGEHLHTAVLHGGLLAGQAGQAATAAARRRGAWIHQLLNPRAFPPRPGNPGYRTPAGIVPLIRRSGGGMRPGGRLAPGARGPAPASPAGGPVPRRETPFPDAAARGRLAARLADKRARDAAASAPDAAARAARGASRLGLHTTFSQADQQLRNQASATSGHNTPFGSGAGRGTHARTGMRQPGNDPDAGSAGGQAGRVPVGSAARRRRLRQRLDTPPNG